MNPVQQLTQEVAEVRAAIIALVQLWEISVSGPCPDEAQFYVWLGLHQFGHIAAAIRETGVKQSKRAVKMDADHLVRFCSRVANDRKRLARQLAARLPDAA
jgi:hypothetical protein